MRAIDNGYGCTPVALTGNQPIPEPVGNRRFPPPLFLEISVNFFLSFFIG
jgi:hypothetical protein